MKFLVDVGGPSDGDVARKNRIHRERELGGRQKERHIGMRNMPEGVNSRIGSAASDHPDRNFVNFGKGGLENRLNGATVLLQLKSDKIRPVVLRQQNGPERQRVGKRAGRIGSQHLGISPEGRRRHRIYPSWRHRQYRRRCPSRRDVSPSRERPARSRAYPSSFPEAE